MKTMRSLALVLLLGVTLYTAPGGRADTMASVQPAMPVRSRFLYHLGIAYYAIHYVIHVDAKGHPFLPGTPERSRRLLEAGDNLLYAYHEIMVSYDLAEVSPPGLLHSLVPVIKALSVSVGTPGLAFKQGAYKTDDLRNLQQAAVRFRHLARDLGFVIVLIATKLPES